MLTCSLTLSHPEASRKTAFQGPDMCTAESLATSQTEISVHQRSVTKTWQRDS